MDKITAAQLLALASGAKCKKSGEEFSQKTIDEAWERSGGQCECKRHSCDHKGRCNKHLTYDHHKEGETGAWEAHHKVARAAGGKDTPSNCEILCLECHKKTGSYGKHN